MTLSNRPVQLAAAGRPAAEQMNRCLTRPLLPFLLPVGRLHGLTEPCSGPSAGRHSSGVSSQSKKFIKKDRTCYTVTQPARPKDDFHFKYRIRPGAGRAVERPASSYKSRARCKATKQRGRDRPGGSQVKRPDLARPHLACGLYACICL